MSESSFKLSKLGSVDRNSNERTSFRESYFFASGQIEFVAYNATVQGNFIGRQSIHTEPVQRIRYLVKYGWMFGFHKWDLAISGNNMRRETRQSQDHYFITFDIVRRL
ncbi:MAG: DUF2219 family protein [Bacteroidetes bacterium]|nr:DUF2219 family protein [Bacteroidota bacterium]